MNRSPCPPPRISFIVARDLACNLGINTNQISLKEWRQCLIIEARRNWQSFCDLNLLAEAVRDNLIDDLNFYQNLSWSGNARPSGPVHSDFVVDPDIICDIGASPTTDVIRHGWPLF